MMAADTMEALGIPRGSYVVKVNNRKVLDGVMESIGLGGDENSGTRLTVLRAIDKLDKFPVDGVEKIAWLWTVGWRRRRKGRLYEGARTRSDREYRSRNQLRRLQASHPRDRKATSGSNAVTIANFEIVVEERCLRSSKV